MNETPIDPHQQLQINFRTAPEQYEYLARLAASAGHNSVNKIIEQRVFRRGWRNELVQLREVHRRLGHNDEDFYHTSVRRKLGFKDAFARKKRRIINPVVIK